MQALIHGASYMFSGEVLAQRHTREGYFGLVKASFGLDFAPWYQSGYWDDRFIPYVLYDGSEAVSSVGVCVNDVIWQNGKKRYAQISTEMTVPAYRGKGLSRWLTEYALAEWKGKCDAIYLLGNDSVVDFYPRFGFEKWTEYDFTIPLKKTKGEYRKLNLNNADDLALLAKKYEVSNPFAALKVENLGQFMFHCMTFHAQGIDYLKAYDAVAIVENEGNRIICYDILTDSHAPLGEMLGVLATDVTEHAYLGFTPKATVNCTAIESQEEDNHLFVLSGKENLFKGNQVMFPLLSRA